MSGLSVFATYEMRTTGPWTYEENTRVACWRSDVKSCWTVAGQFFP